MARRELWRRVDDLEKARAADRQEFMAFKRVLVLLAEDKISERQKQAFEEELRKRFSQDD